ncbi:MAG TPA: sugar-transfer associated ATP-grasp domain-containing protein [Aequorivita sp.]|nr:sugar-transfer associated ATP-grasp domain-containing protein [Aequorivita sp.]
MKKILYLGFFILKTNYDDLRKSLVCANRRGYSTYRLVGDMLYCSLFYGSSFVDYFNFQFYRRNKAEKRAYATMGIMYTFHRKVNDKRFIDKVDDKKEFFKNFSEFCNTPYFFEKSQCEEIKLLLDEKEGKKIVIKDPVSTGGKGVKISKIEKMNGNLTIEGVSAEAEIKEHFIKNSFFYFEDYIEQHEEISKISPTAVNTIRIITMVNAHRQPEIIGAVFRISVDCPIDNYSAGNLAAEIDIDTGIVVSGGIRKRSTCDIYHDVHPITKQAILGFQIPHWAKIVVAVKKAALIVPEVRSVGWDVAVTQDGPLFIEGNSQWNKDTWQIPADRGKLSLISVYL